MVYTRRFHEPYSGYTVDTTHWVWNHTKTHDSNRMLGGKIHLITIHSEIVTTKKL